MDMAFSEKNNKASDVPFDIFTHRFHFINTSCEDRYKPMTYCVARWCDGSDVRLAIKWLPDQLVACFVQTSQRLWASCSHIYICHTI